MGLSCGATVPGAGSEVTLKSRFDSYSGSFRRSGAPLLRRTVRLPAAFRDSRISLRSACRSEEGSRASAPRLDTPGGNARQWVRSHRPPLYRPRDVTPSSSTTPTLIFFLLEPFLPPLYQPPNSPRL